MEQCRRIPATPPQYPFNVEECDAITDISWDSENSVLEIPATGFGTIYVLDGKPSFTYEVSGTNFYLDAAGTTKKEEEVAERQHEIYTINACGTGKVTVTDSCGKQATGLIPTDIALKWDETLFVEEMEINATHILQIVDGSPPYRIEVAGNGFYIDNEGTPEKSIEQSGNSFTLQTINACGGAIITVSDSCSSTITTDVRSSAGHWVDINASICDYPALAENLFTETYSGYNQTLINKTNTRKISQSYHGRATRKSNSALWEDFIANECENAWAGQRVPAEVCVRPINYTECPDNPGKFYHLVNGYEGHHINERFASDSYKVEKFLCAP